MKNKKSRSGGLAARIAERLELPPDSFCGGYRLELNSSRELTISGCLRIVEYTGERVAVAVRGKLITITGNCLECENFIDGTVAVRGDISLIEIGGGGK